MAPLDMSDAKRLKSLEDENIKLKRLLAEAILDNATLKEYRIKTEIHLHTMGNEPTRLAKTATPAVAN